MRWPVEGRLNLGFGVALALLALLGVSSYRSTTLLISSSGWATHAGTVMEHLQGTLWALESAESDCRGYVLTGDPSFVQRYRLSVAEIERRSDVLRHLVAADAGQENRFAFLEPVVASEVAWSDSVIATTSQLGAAAGTRLVQSGRSEALMGEAARMVADMAKVETGLLRSREADAHADARRALAITGFTTLAAIALLAIAYVAVRMGMARRRRVDASLRENEIRFQTILDNTHASIYVMDLQGRLMLVNKTIESHWNKTREQLIGTTVYDLMDKGAADILHQNIEAVFASSEPLVIEEVIPLADGPHTLLSVKSALRDSNGVCYGLCGISTDITDRKRTESELEHVRLFLDSIIENIPDMVFVKDAKDLRFIRLNRAGEDLLGFSRSDLMGKNDYDFFPADQAEFFVAKDREVLRGGETLDIPEEAIQTKSRGTRTLHTKKVPISDSRGVPRYLLGIAEDITERKRAENQITVLNSHLRERAAELEAANQELEAFSYSVSHDLRAPLRHIDGFTDLLGRHAGATMDAKSRRYLDQISDSAKNMGCLIDDLLVFSRMGRSELQSTTVSLDQLVEQARHDLAHEVTDRVIDWHIAPLPEIQGDPAMLKLVFNNLLANAIKYTRTQPTARIEVGAVESDAETTVFVRDNGVGFDMQYAHKLFGVFQRLHRQDEFEGTGIGLANVRRIIGRHGGRTWAESELGRGATFSFALPRAEAMEVEHREAA